MDQRLRRLRTITEDSGLNPAQKAHLLALGAEELLPYPPLGGETRRALNRGVEATGAVVGRDVVAP